MPASSAHPAHSLSGAQGAWVLLDGAREGEVYGRLVATGPPDGPQVVFLHGLVGVNEHWLEVVRRVSHQIRCLLLEVPLLELRGEDCSVQGVARMVASFLERHVGEPATLVGSSFGGHTALRVALMRRELVRALVLVGSSGLGERPLGTGRPKRTREWIEEVIAELFYDRTKMPVADVDRAFAELSDRQKARRLLNLSRSVFKDKIAAHLCEIEAPTLVLWGREDTVTPPEAARGFAEAIPNAELVWIDRCGHAPMLEAPEVFANALLTFSERLVESA